MNRVMSMRTLAAVKRAGDLWRGRTRKTAAPAPAAGATSGKGKSQRKLSRQESASIIQAAQRGKMAREEVSRSSAGGADVIARAKSRRSLGLARAKSARMTRERSQSRGKSASRSSSPDVGGGDGGSPGGSPSKQRRASCDYGALDSLSGRGTSDGGGSSSSGGLEADAAAQPQGAPAPAPAPGSDGPARQSTGAGGEPSPAKSRGSVRWGDLDPLEA